MFRALSSAATGMDAQEKQVQSIANNIANVNTTGFKKQRVEFQDLLYDTLTPPGAKTSEQTQSPTGLQIGQGVRTVGTVREFSMGSVQATNRVFDVAIEGAGFFKIKMPDGNFGYTRAGSFQLNAQGQMVTPEGYELDPGVVIPAGVKQVHIAGDGNVSATFAGDTAVTELGTITLSDFSNPTGLQAIGHNLYSASPSSGEPMDVPPGTQGVGTLLSGHLETANVKVVDEMVQLIAAQRAYESNSRVIKAADQMLRSTANLK